MTGIMTAARLLSKRSFMVPGKLNISELFFQVPIDYSQPDGRKLSLFARAVERSENPVDLSKHEPKQSPWFVYLQGGPGMPCRSPQNYPWIHTVLDKGYQILFLDQRGTGLSSTVTSKTLDREGGSVKQADYLKFFRADNIVQDCEAIRKTLTADFPEANKKWTLLGQSFGGFCCVNYLSKFPEGLREVFTAGGLPPLVNAPDTVYEKLFSKVRERNETYYRKYPEDVQRVKDIAGYIQKEKIILPSGGKLSLLRLRQLGFSFGFHGGIDEVHELILRLHTDWSHLGFFTRPTLAAIASSLDFDTFPLYALVHEPCYVQGASSNWAADRVIQRFPEFMMTDTDSTEPILFTGEMVFREMFDDYDELPRLKETADILAKYQDWPQLYDERQLAKNEVPVYSATFVEDMYVHFDLARETATKIKNCKQFITNIMYHNALGGKSEDLMKQLFALRDDVID